jgi:hypothetical protein
MAIRLLLDYKERIPGLSLGEDYVQDQARAEAVFISKYGPGVIRQNGSIDRDLIRNKMEKLYDCATLDATIRPRFDLDKNGVCDKESPGHYSLSSPAPAAMIAVDDFIEVVTDETNAQTYSKRFGMQMTEVRVGDAEALKNRLIDSWRLLDGRSNQLFRRLGGVKLFIVGSLPDGVDGMANVYPKEKVTSDLDNPKNQEAVIIIPASKIRGNDKSGNSVKLMGVIAHELIHVSDYLLPVSLINKQASSIEEEVDCEEATIRAFVDYENANSINGIFSKSEYGRDVINESENSKINRSLIRNKLKEFYVMRNIVKISPTEAQKYDLNGDSIVDEESPGHQKYDYFFSE